MIMSVWLTLEYGSLNLNMVFVCRGFVERALWMVEIQIEKNVVIGIMDCSN
jgi:hypothetical protein